MKKKKKTITPNSDTIALNNIRVDDDIKFSSDKDLNIGNFKVVQFFIVFITTICTLYMAVSFLEIEVENIKMIFSVSLLSFSFSVINQKNRIAKFIGIGCLAIHTISLFSKLSAIRNGFFIVINTYLKKANQTSTVFGTYLKTINPAEYEYCQTQFFIFFATILITVLAIACSIKIDFPLMLVMTFPVFELGVYWGWNPKLWTAIGLFSCWVIVLSLHIINHSTNKEGRGNTFAIHKKKNIFYFTSENIKYNFFSIYAKLIAVLCAVVFLFTALFSSLTGFVRPEKFNALRKEISTTVDDIAYKGFSEAMADSDGIFGLFSTKTVGGINGGKLGRSSSISFNGSTALKIETEKVSYPLYLKGYVAGEYKNNNWTQIDIDKNDDIFSTFDENEIWPQDFNYMMINEQMLAYPEYPIMIGDTQEMDVTVVGASKKFAYAPYMSLYSEADTSDNKKMTPNKESFVDLNSKKYSINFFNMSPLGNTWEDISNRLIERSYFDNSLNNNYAQFIYDNYLDIQESQALDSAYDSIMHSYNYDESFMQNPVFAAGAVADYLSENYKYTLSPGQTPSDEDFIDYFLTEQKEGFCSYFASTGVMLMRRLGIPARYVEGYVVLPTQFDNNDGEKQTITVTDKSAHAWCEIFISGIGWVPCEFTPGYQNDNPNMTTDEKDPNEIKTTTTTITTKTDNLNSNSDSSQSSSSSNSDSSKETNSSSTISSSLADTISQKSGSNTNDNKHDFTFICYILGAILIFALVILRRKYNLTERKKRFNSPDKNKALLNIYQYYLKYLSLISIQSNKNLTDTQLAKELILQCKEKGIKINGDDFIKLSNLAVKSEMSNEEISAEEIKFSKKALADVAKNVVRNELSPLKKFVSKWIYNLY